MSFSANQRRGMAFAMAVIATVALVLTLKLPGLFLAVVLAVAMWTLASARPDASEHDALRSSIALSREDLMDVIAEYEKFATSQEADYIADRTLHRPALLDLDCAEPAIEAFHYEMHGAQRFLRRLDVRLHTPDVERNELESLLKVTDQRAAELKQTWLSARRAALTLGPHYGRKRRGA